MCSQRAKGTASASVAGWWFKGRAIDVGATRHGRKCEPKRRLRRGAISEGDWRIAERHPVRRAVPVFHTRAGRFLAGCWKSPPAPEIMAREARDMRERRDVERMGSHFVWPVSRLSCGSVRLFSRTSRPSNVICVDMVFPHPVGAWFLPSEMS